MKGLGPRQWIDLLVMSTLWLLITQPWAGGWALPVAWVSLFYLYTRTNDVYVDHAPAGWMVGAAWLGGFVGTYISL
jgi:hypothetical protein